MRAITRDETLEFSYTIEVYPCLFPFSCIKIKHTWHQPTLLCSPHFIDHTSVSRGVQSKIKTRTRNSNNSTIHTREHVRILPNHYSFSAIVTHVFRFPFFLASFVVFYTQQMMWIRVAGSDRRYCLVNLANDTKHNSRYGYEHINPCGVGEESERQEDTSALRFVTSTTEQVFRFAQFITTTARNGAHPAKLLLNGTKYMHIRSAGIKSWVCDRNGCSITTIDYSWQTVNSAAGKSMLNVIDNVIPDESEIDKVFTMYE